MSALSDPYAAPHPVGLVVSDDLRRSRLTTLFRLLLGIPHYVWLALWSILVLILAIVGWLLTLVLGRLPGWFHRLFCAYIRYVSHVAAYIAMVANPFPGFVGEPGSYPVDVVLEPLPSTQSRLKTLFRVFLALPVMLVSGLAGGGGPVRVGAVGGELGLTGICAILGWFASLVRGRIPHGLRDAGAYGIGFRARVLAYLLFVTDVYPFADPASVLERAAPVPLHPVRIAQDADDLRRSRLTVLFRLPLLVPLLVWGELWGLAVVVALIVQWLVTLARGRPIEKLHAFASRYVRFTFHVWAFGSLTANPFPGFTGRPGSYPLDLVLPPAERQNRWKTLFRLLLAFPAAVVNGVLSVTVFLDAILLWFAALALGRAPRGLRNLSVYGLRYAAQLNAYSLLVTDRYPFASPLEGSAETAPAAVDTPAPFAPAVA